MQAIIEELRQSIERFRRAIEYLDGCESFDFDAYTTAVRMTGSTISDAELQSMWDSTKLILPGPGHSGGPDALRMVTRESFVNGIEDAEKLIARLQAIG